MEARAAQTPHERDCREAVAPGHAVHRQQGGEQIPGSGQRRRAQPEEARCLEMQPSTFEEVRLDVSAVDRAQQTKRLSIGAEKNVLAVVNHPVAKLDASSATAERGSGFEDGDRASGASERDRSCKPSPATADHGDPPVTHRRASFNTTTRSSTRATPW